MTARRLAARVASDYGLVVALLVLCGALSAATLADQPATGPAALDRLAADVVARAGPGAAVLVAARDTPADAALADGLPPRLTAAGAGRVAVVRGGPPDVRRALGEHKPAAAAAPQGVADWPVFEAAGVPVLAPRGARWPNFLKADNLLNIANQITVIAVLAVGMTLVVIGGGIDLSVGSLIALSAVVTALLIRDAAGAEAATPVGMAAACLGGVAACGAVGALSGGLVAGLRLPPFLVTLATMLVASGAAYLLTGGQSVYQLPPGFVWLGRGADLLGVPNAVVLTGLLYLAAHVLLSRTPAGRYVYAVGGNPEAARLAGVPVGRVVVGVYAASGALAGVGGVIMASQLNSGAPTYGGMYELYVIAAVVVGGTSLSGGEGRVAGTLLGALLIAVIQNGMNLLGVESYTQKVVLGLVILGAVLVDRLKARRG